MPVPTDTFRDIKKLNYVFALTAVLLLAATGALIKKDYEHPWRGYQKEGREWETALTTETANKHQSVQDEKRAKELTEEIRVANEKLAADTTIPKARAALADAKARKGNRDLPLALSKGELGPLQQQIERATLEHGDRSNQVAELLKKYQKQLEDYNTKYVEMVAIDAEIKAANDTIAKALSEQDTLRKRIADLTKERDGAREKLKQVNPQGWAKIGQEMRNAPLLNWFNPTDGVKQVVTTAVRTDMNFVTTETTDRCATCHVNIDKPAFEEHTLIKFIERQIALSEGQDVDNITAPVVMLDYWTHAAAKMDGDFAKTVKGISEKSLTELNDLRSTAGLPALEADKLAAEMEKLTKAGDAKDKEGAVVVKKSQWYDVVVHYSNDLRGAFAKSLSKEDYKSLVTLYRHVLTDEYNKERAKDGLGKPLTTSALQLAHPSLGLFAEADSKHPMTKFGCTVCHEGSGQETIFEHTAHTPREIFVDAESGAPVPAFLVISKGDHGKKVAKAEGKSDGKHDAKVTLAANTVESGKSEAKSDASAHPAASGSVKNGAEAGVGAGAKHEHGRSHGAASTHQDVKITDLSDPAPFAPKVHAHASSYQNPIHGVRKATTQEEYWKHEFGWAEVHYMHWEKPMHSLEYVESSCAKCHTAIFDLKETAPKLYEGRQLFVELGCIDCHAVNSVINNDADAHAKLKDYAANQSPDKANESVARKVGPSLVHVKEKLSADMMASWIWSPKAFRPTTRMPHFFMLENNSTPIDIARTRVETAAMTHYLLNIKPGSESVQPTYTPEKAPATAGDAKVGKELFNTLGCLACHTNLSEVGEKLVVGDLVKNKHFSEEDATKKFKEMTFNQQHWYVMENLPEKLVNFGPELSGVGTKLKAGRTEDQARGWLFDWLRNPRHYSSYTLMPSLRLTETEANDLTSYLLGLERADYKPENFNKLDTNGVKMLNELVAQLNAGKSTLAEQREVAAKMAEDEKLNFLGKKMITHYGCNSCHAISGFETAAATCLNLGEAEWGLKDPHLLDFGYFDHAFDKQREQAAGIEVWKVKSEGLEADAPQIKANSETDHDAKIAKRTVAWEHMSLERRPWLYQKLHNPRVYDRARTGLDKTIGESGSSAPNVGKPYDKIKMPKFFLTDEQVHAIVTYVTSIRKPLVSDDMKAATYTPAKKFAAEGRQQAERFNCYGCHNIEGNDVHIQQFYDVVGEDGRLNFDNLNNAPPRLVGQGSKTQPEWLHHFLRNVEPLRPWLKVRMPSFHIETPQSTNLANYFAGASLTMRDHLTAVVKPIRAHLKAGIPAKSGVAQSDDIDTLIKAYDEANPERPWHKAANLATALAELKAWALKLDVTFEAALSSRETSAEDLTKNWNKILSQVCFIAGVNNVEYPFPPTVKPVYDAERFARGEAFFNQLGCVKCHAFGDEHLLQQIWELDHKKPDPAATKKKAADDEEEEDAAPAATGPVYSAPNLSRAHRRIQHAWFQKWVQEPGTMQPGTKMPPWFPGGKSAFAAYPEEAKAPLEAQFGYTAEEQMSLLIDYIYVAGAQNYTPNVERLGGKKKEVIELKPLEKPKDLAPTPAKTEEKSEGETKGEAKPAAKPEAKAEPAPEAKPEVLTSAIELNEGSAAYKGTRVVGVITFAGAPPKKKRLDIASDPGCVAMHKVPIFDPSLVINADKSISNVFVYVKGLPTSAAPATAAILDQRGCEYIPHVIGVIAGQQVTALNSDALLHNVKFESKQNGSQNVGMPSKGMKLNIKTAKPEFGATFKCDVHPWMGAVMNVMPNQFFSVTDVQGRFEIKDLPPGTYEIGTWHERDGKGVKTKTASVTVEADKSTRVDIELSEK